MSNTDKKKLWDLLEKPVAQTVEEVQNIIQTPPEQITIPEMNLSGPTAKYYHVLSTIIKATMKLSDEEIAYYLLRVGIEKEIGALGSLSNKNGEND